MNETCSYCHEKSSRSKGYVNCSTCESWAHLKCAKLSKLSPEELFEVNWICNVCKNEFGMMKKKISDLEIIIDNLNGLSKQVEEAKK